MAPSLVSTEIGAATTITDAEHWWVCQAIGMTVCGHDQTRPVLIVGDQMKFASIKAPYYGAGWADPTVGGGVAALTVAQGASGTMTDATSITVCEVWYSEHTGERSPAGAETTLAGPITSKKINVTSTAKAPTSELLITHREFYVKYYANGAYYRGAQIAYTGLSDSTTIDISADNIVSKRPLETAGQTGMYPAVDTAEYWRGRLWGANIASRVPAIGSTLTLTNGSNIATLTGDTFRDDDAYRSIVYLTTNQIYAYISRVLTTTTAIVTFADPSQTTWTGTTTTLASTTWKLGGDSGLLYTTPIYIGEAASGITYGMVTYNPLDTVRDENLYASGARIKMLKRIGDDMLVVYDRAVVLLQGDMSISAPAVVRMWVVAENVGTWNPRTIWQDGRGTIWFQGNGRLYQTSGGRVVEITNTMDASSWYDLSINTTSSLMKSQRVAFDMWNDMSIVAGATEWAKYGTEPYRFGYVIQHGTDAPCIQPMRWPVPFYSVFATITDDGFTKVYAGSKDKRLYQLFVSNQYQDTYTDPDTATYTIADVSWWWQTGVDWMDGTAYTHAIRLLQEVYGSPDDSITYEAQAYNTNRLRKRQGWAASISHTLTSAQQDMETYHVARVGGWGLAHRLSGSSNYYIRLLELTVWLDTMTERGVMS